MRDAHLELTERRQALVQAILPLAMRDQLWNYADAMHQSDMRDWQIAMKQLAAINTAIDGTPPEEDDEPGGDIDWGEGDPLSAS